MRVTLLEAQRDFLDAVLDGRAMRARIHPQDAIDVYRNNVRANRRSALAASYPVVLRLVGEAFFDEAAARFADVAPSRSGDLNRYGAAFDAFLGQYEPARSLPYLADVARLEWMVHESSIAVDAAPFDFEALSRVPPDRHGDIRFALAPAARLMRSEYPVAAIWEANQPGRDGVPARGDGRENVLVRRDESAIAMTVLEETDWLFLCAVSRRCMLAQASEALHASARSGLPGMLSHWTAAGVIASFGLSEGHA